MGKGDNVKNEITIETLRVLNKMAEAMAILAKGTTYFTGPSIHEVPRGVAEEYAEEFKLGIEYLGDDTDVIRSGYMTVFTDSKQDEVTELTLEEVAELKGIPVEKLRIKDN